MNEGRMSLVGVIALAVTLFAQVSFNWATSNWLRNLEDRVQKLEKEAKP